MSQAGDFESATGIAVAAGLTAFLVTACITLAVMAYVMWKDTQ